MASQKSLILADLDTRLKAITAVKSVKRLDAFATELDNVPMPAVYYLDAIEEMVKQNINIAEITMTLDLQVFIKLTPAGQSSFHTVADALQGPLTNALSGLLNPETGQVIKLSRIKIEKNFPSDIVGAMLIEAVLSYVTPWGDFAGDL